jgi:hypothetical protein
MTRAEQLALWLPQLASTEQDQINNSGNLLLVIVPCGSAYYPVRGFTTGEVLDLVGKVKTSKEIDSINTLMLESQSRVFVGVRPKRIRK